MVIRGLMFVRLLKKPRDWSKTADEYNKIAPIGGGRAKRVDREIPSGNDFLSGTNLEHNLERMRKQKVQVM